MRLPVNILDVPKLKKTKIIENGKLITNVIKN